MENHISKIEKRDGTVVDFNQEKIANAVHKAVVAAGQGNGEVSKKVSDKVVQLLNRRFKKDEVPTIEQIQDIVEEALILEDLVETAKAYIIYRDQRRKIREAGKVVDDSNEKVDSYLAELDWQVKENANMTFSLQGLNQYVGSYISKKYWLNKIYPKEIRDAATNEDFHIHNLELLAPYCAGWDLYDFLRRGFGGVTGKIECMPPKHLRTALGQLVNVLFTLQGETAGANAVSNFDTLLAPFIRYDNLNYKQVKQAMQEFLFNCMVPTRVGFQTPFLNVSLDIKPPSFLAKQPVIIGGEPQNETYGEFQEEINMFIKAFYEGIMDGDAKGRPFTFPIPTVSITKDFDWDNPNLVSMWEATAKYGINYFSNFIHSDMNPEDARSMCCRLRLDNRELYKRGGGLFGSSPKTGSVGVVTIDLPRIGYLSKTKKDFFDKLGNLMNLAKESLEIKRKTLENFMDKGLYPYSKHYLEE
ncbi:MAG: ribonucleoside triphosphate reductase, partial [Patescibacteria group bacterium]